MGATVGDVVVRNGVRYKLVPPEGGWGYMICLSMAVQFLALFTLSSSFGLIYNDFLIELGEGTSGVTLVHGVHSISLSVTAFISNALLKRLSVRQLSLLGSVIFCVGTFLGIFVKSITHVLITNGMIQAAGLGLIFPLNYTAFNRYFTQRRLAYLSAIKLLIGLGAVVTPLLVRISMEEYGFRGTLAIVFAFSLNSFLASIMLQPVDWHLKLQEIKADDESEESPLKPDQERGESMQTEIKDTILGVGGMQRDENDTAKETFLIASYESAKSENYISEKLKKAKREKEEPLYKSADCHKQNGERGSERRFSYDALDSQDEEYIANLVRASSIMSLSNLTHVPVEPLPPIVDKRGRLKVVVEYFDLSLFKDLVYTNIIIGMAMASFSDSTFNALLPLFLYKIGWDSVTVAQAVALVATGDMVARFLLIIISKMMHVKARYLYFLGMLTTVLLRCVFVVLHGTMPRLIVLTAVGLTRCLLHVTSPLVLAEHVPIQRYPAAYSLFILVYGFINLLGGPVIGMIRDVTGSYPLVFNILTSVLVIFCMPWVVEMYLLRRKTTKEQFVEKDEKLENK